MIEIRNVGFRYEGAARQALTDVSLTVGKGELLAVVGHNGSGKSTLSKMMNALLLPGEGKVLVDGMDTADEKNVLEIRRRVGMIFQNPDNQLVTTMVEEDVAFGPENLGVPPEEIRARVKAALDAVGMRAYAENASHALSGGQKQRIAIAGTLAMQPEILVMDEATAMLDPSGRNDVLDTVLRLRREDGLTVVMITQFMEEASLCDRVAVMNGGRLVALGTPREIFSDREALLACGLELPPAVLLRDELTRCGMKIEGDPISCEELAEAICRSR